MTIIDKKCAIHQILLVPNFLKDPTLDSVISMWDTPVYTQRSRNLSREETDEENV